mmetsp:Transcript_3859/g.5869  ORF Transcript_3859/g.5869 Transcript_3859/m.5869 type:complete len:85 (-) Transcript_3859:38-292(-)
MRLILAPDDSDLSFDELGVDLNPQDPVEHLLTFLSIKENLLDPQSLLVFHEGRPLNIDSNLLEEKLYENAVVQVKRKKSCCTLL